MRRKLLNIGLIIILLASIFINPILAIGDIGYENFLLFTEVGDVNGRVSVYEDNVQFITVNNEKVLVYYDYGFNTFSDNFSIDFGYTPTQDNDGAFVIFALANKVDTYENIVSANSSELCLTASGYGISGQKIQLRETIGGSEFYSNAINLSLDTNYYLTIYRNEDYASYGQLVVDVYSDNGRTVLIDTESITLHEKLDLQYLYVLQNYAMDNGTSIGGTIFNLLLDEGGGFPPEVVIFDCVNANNSAYMSAFVSSTANVSETGFDIGVTSGNYTNSFVANWVNWWYLQEAEIDTILSGQFDYVVSNTGLIHNQEYFVRAWATNEYGTSYSEEISFIWDGYTLNELRCWGLEITEGANGDYSATFVVRESPCTSSIIEGYLSPDYPPLTNNVTLYEILTRMNSEGFCETLFSTGNRTSPEGGFVLSPDTTYYYQASANISGKFYWSTIKSFTTGNVTSPIASQVIIKKITDVSEYYGENYVIEVVAEINSSNMTNVVVQQGIEFSMSKQNNILLDPIYKYNSPNVDADGTYTMIFKLGNADWYNGETLYFRAFIYDYYYGDFYSVIIEFTPKNNLPAGTSGNEFAEMVKAFRISLGMTGAMGTWAFMGTILLIVALIFGSATYAQKDNDTAKAVLSTVWGLLSIAVVGAFVFTGELGVWPILILVGGFVSLIIIVLSVRLSGGGKSCLILA